MSCRIRELEDGLRAAVSSSHPLLSGELLAIKAPLERSAPEFRSLVSASQPVAIQDGQSPFGATTPEVGHAEVFK